jgi:hypothetical protein
MTTQHLDCVLSRLLKVFLVAILFFAVSGCMKWSPGFLVEGYGKPGGDPRQLLDKASRLEATVDTREGLLEMAAAYEAAAAADPKSRKALIGVANARIILATGYTSTRGGEGGTLSEGNTGGRKSPSLKQRFSSSGGSRNSCLGCGVDAGEG